MDAAIEDLEDSEFKKNEEFLHFTIASLKLWLEKTIKSLGVAHELRDIDMMMLVIYYSGDFLHEITRRYKFGDSGSDSRKFEVFCEWIVDQAELKLPVRSPEILTQIVMEMKRKRQESHVSYLRRLESYSYLINAEFEDSVHEKRLFWSSVHRNSNSWVLRLIADQVLRKKNYEDNKDDDPMKTLFNNADSIDCKNKAYAKSKTRRCKRECINCLRKSCHCCFICGSSCHFSRDCPMY